MTDVNFAESMKLMVGILWHDVVSARDFLLEEYSDQFRRRIFIRAIFAFIEGSLNAISKVILAQHEILDYQLTKKDFEVLTEMSEEKDQDNLPFVKKFGECPIFECGKKVEIRKAKRGRGV